MAALIRELTYPGDGSDVKGAVIVVEPFASGGDWGCRYDIRWPDGGEVEPSMVSTPSKLSR